MSTSKTHSLSLYSSRRPFNGVPVLTGMFSSGAVSPNPAADTFFCSLVAFFNLRGL
jgi:hypothetical protein